MWHAQSIWQFFQVVGLERIAIVIPAEAIGQFQSALGTCQEQHASGVVSTARVQPQLPPNALTSNPSGGLGGSIAAAPPPAPSTASAPATPSHADHHNQMVTPHLAPHLNPQVKPHAIGCGVQLSQHLEHMHPLCFQPMWILPPAGAAALMLVPEALLVLLLPLISHHLHGFLLWSEALKAFTVVTLCLHVWLTLAVYFG